MKYCIRCKTTKSYDDFYKNKLSKDGHYHYCKSCKSDYSKKKYDNKRVFPEKKNGKLIHCRRCWEYLEQDQFPKIRKNGKYSSFTYCKKCDDEIGTLFNLKRFNMTREDYVKLEEKQNKKCKICNEKENKNKRLSVDHNHECCDGAFSCGKCIRGLLCSRCNKVLGQVNDDRNILENMINYLESS